MPTFRADEHPPGGAKVATATTPSGGSPQRVSAPTEVPGDVQAARRHNKPTGGHRGQLQQVDDGEAGVERDSERVANTTAPGDGVLRLDHAHELSG